MVTTRKDGNTYTGKSGAGGAEAPRASIADGDIPQAGGEAPLHPSRRDVAPILVSSSQPSLRGESSESPAHNPPPLGTHHFR